MKSAKLGLIALLVATLAAPAAAQPGPGMGMGGMGGMGPGKGGRMAFNQGNTPGWTLMTQQERQAHREKMWSFKTFEECKAYQAEHHAQMEARAKEKGSTLPAPRANACDRMKARGALK